MAHSVTLKFLIKKKKIIPLVAVGLITLQIRSLLLEAYYYGITEVKVI